MAECLCSVKEEDKDGSEVQILVCKLTGTRNSSDEVTLDPGRQGRGGGSLVLDRGLGGSLGEGVCRADEEGEGLEAGVRAEDDRGR